MDDASFGLSESFRVLHQAGIRHLLPGTPSVTAEVPGYTPDWASLVAKVPASPLAILTYRQLGQDLTSGGNAERSALWRRLFGLLALPKGSLGFLPYAFSTESGDDLHVTSFFDHVATINPLFVFIFDSDADHPLLLNQGVNLQQSASNTVIRQCYSVDQLLHLSDEQFKSFSMALRSELLDARN